MSKEFTIFPVGIIHKNENQVKIEIYKPYLDGMLGIEGFSHFMVLYWFDRNDHPDARKTLQVNPRKDPKNPLTGVFGTHSPLRPNLIAMSICKKTKIDGSTIYIQDIDAFDGSPVIDIKPWIPLDILKTDDIDLPDWV